LGDTKVSTQEIKEVKNLLHKNGVLLTVKPQGRLLEFLGLEDSNETQLDGCLKVENEAASLIRYNGLLQIFGESRLYSGGKRVVRFVPSEAYPGIIEVNDLGGSALVLAFDVYETFISMQQSRSECRKAVDVSRVRNGLERIPQLDLLRRLIINLITSRIPAPTPRKWYYPEGSRSLLLVGGDQDGSGVNRLRVVQEMARETQAPYTLFLMTTSQPMTREEIRGLVSDGFEIAFHPDFFKYIGNGEIAGRPFTEEEFHKQYEKAILDSGVQIKGIRTHALQWKSVYEIPLWMERRGIQYDTSLGLHLVEGEKQKLGYYMGSSLPYYFIHPDTYRRINVLEQPFIAGDDVLFWPEISNYMVKIIPNKERVYRLGLGLSEDEAFTIIKEFMDESISWNHATQCYIWHPVYLASQKLGESFHHSDRFFRKTIKYAKQRKVSILNHGEWNTFWRGREEARFKNVSWDIDTRELRFALEGPVPKGLTVALPRTYRSEQARVYINGKETEYQKSDLMGQQYALISSKQVHASYTVKY